MLNYVNNYVYNICLVIFLGENDDNVCCRKNKMIVIKRQLKCPKAN